MEKYLDGGIADSIPVFKCKEMGYDKVIVVLTRPLEYRKKPYHEALIKLMSLRYKKYPKFIECLKNCYKMYNEVVEKIIEMEKSKEIFVIRPSESINVKVIERNKNNLQSVYDLGVRNCKSIMKELKNYLL